MVQGEAGTGNVVEAVRHCRAVQGAIRALQTMDDDEVYVFAKELRAPVELVRQARPALGCCPLQCLWVWCIDGLLQEPTLVLLPMPRTCIPGKAACGRSVCCMASAGTAQCVTCVLWMARRTLSSFKKQGPSRRA